MNKLEMAHDFAMKLVGNPTTPLKDMDSIIAASWRYADTMQKELDERSHIVDSNETVDEWQPDWSQAAPEWANHLAMTLAGTSYWFESTPHPSGNGWIAKGKSQLAFCDMYHKGDWRESLRSRP